MSETRGLFSPSTGEEVREQYKSAGPAAQTVTREVAREMDFSKEEYEDRITSGVVETARDALFASLLRVQVGSEAEFDDVKAAQPDAEVILRGSEDVDHVAWHYSPVADTLVGATFQDKPDAAVATLRRIVFGRVYRNVLE